VASNADNSITFTSQHFTKTSGSSLCFANGYFTAKYAPVTDAGAAVNVN
ncbi:Tat pathway signal sequence domain protein, partial [Streptomyces hayashii]